jgi:CDP-diacylglycerol--glycerol-3-phosphate 3-phosphatidyltransferase
VNKNINIANALTLFRLFALPVFAYMALSDNGILQFAAAILFGLAALTDWLDGYLARKLSQISEFGAILDPLVDRIFIITSLVVLYSKVSELVPLWTVIIIAVRDLFMIIGWMFFKAVRGSGITVSYAGKVATAVLMISLFLLLVSEAIGIKIIASLGVILYYSGLILSVITGVMYTLSALKSNKGKTVV